MQPNLLNQKQAAKFLKIARHTLANRVESGKIKPTKQLKNGRCYFSREDLLTKEEMLGRIFDELKIIRNLLEKKPTNLSADGL